MKHLTFTLIAFTILSMTACKNIKKMVDKGEYDKAISYAVDKLEGKKNRKTKYVKALERAYTKVNIKDQKQIASLRLSNSLNKYDKIYDIYTNMQTRQETVYRLDPLISKDGYIAEFEMIDYVVMIKNTADKAAESHYNEAQRLLSIAKLNDKYAAREAYRRLGYIERYNERYKDTDSLYKEAYDIGVDHVGIEIYQNGIDYTRGEIIEILTDVNVKSLNHFWTQYHIGNYNEAMDYTATIEITNIEAGYEREAYNTYEESKEIEDGVKQVIDLEGNVVKDSLGQIVLTKQYKTVKAEITEMVREKSARLLGKTVIYDNNSKSLVRSVPLEITHVFDDYSATYRGDKRALTLVTKNKLKDNCDLFPSDYDMVMAMIYNFKDSAYEVLSSDIR